MMIEKMMIVSNIIIIISLPSLSWYYVLHCPPNTITVNVIITLIKNSDFLVTIISDMTYCYYCVYYYYYHRYRSVLSLMLLLLALSLYFCWRYYH